MGPMAPQADKPVARTARLLTLLAPGLGHLYLRATWRAFFVTVPLLLLTYLMLTALPTSGSRFPNLVLLYAWYVVCYQVGAQLDLGRVLEQGPFSPRPAVSVLLAWLFVFAAPLSLGGWRLFDQRAGTYVACDDNLFPLVRPDEVVLYRRAVPLERGELVVFQQNQGLHAARIVAIPGDRVRHDGARLEVNGAVLPQVRLGKLGLEPPVPGPALVAWQERLDDGGYLVFHDPDTTPTLQRTEYLEADRYWLLCDARDAAGCADSRTLGPVEAAAIVGSPTHVIWSPIPSRLGFALFARANLTFDEGPADKP